MPVSLTVSSVSEGIPPVTIISDSMNASVNVPESGDYTIVATAVGYVPGPVCTGFKNDVDVSNKEDGKSCCADSYIKRHKKRFNLVNGEWISQRS